MVSGSGAPGRIRTPDPLIRSQVLYPAELPVPNNLYNISFNLYATSKKGNIRWSMDYEVLLKQRFLLFKSRKHKVV